MKLTIEQKDIDNVRENADSHGIMLSEAQAQSLIENNRDLAADLYESDSYLDSSEGLINAIIKEIMGERPDYYEKKAFSVLERWSWPSNQDSSNNPDYCKAFYQAFQESAIAKGYKLANNFGE